MIIFSFNILVEYKQYNSFKNEELFKTNAVILNIYKKENHDILKLKSDNFTFFTSVEHGSKYNKLDTIDIFIITQNISFYNYLKGFYAKSFNLSYIKKSKTIKADLVNLIKKQHEQKDISSVYSALFLGMGLDQNMKELFSSYGISHLIAISGFHLGLISFILYFLLNSLYTTVHTKYFPYRNKRFDLLIAISLILFYYLILIDIAPSFLRSFTMFIIGIIFLRSNIKILSFETLLIITTMIIAFFPKLIFSLSLWFSIAGVFYIFLFIKYFQGLNKYIQLLLFNFWIYLAINPIIHYFFGTTSQEQLYSPIITLVFSIFYPLSAVLHLIGYGNILDDILISFFTLPANIYDIFTPLWFFVSYILLSLFSIASKKAFYILNIVFIIFNLLLYL